MMHTSARVPLGKRRVTKETEISVNEMSLFADYFFRLFEVAVKSGLTNCFSMTIKAI